MSDIPERRRDDGTAGERLASLEANYITLTARVREVAERVHNMGDSLGILAGNSELAHDQRQEMKEQIEALSRKIDPVVQLSIMGPDITQLIQAAKATKIVWSLLIKAGIVIGGVLTFVGTAAWWAYNNLAIRPPH